MQQLTQQVSLNSLQQYRQAKQECNMTCLENITITNIVIYFPIHFKVLGNDYFLKGPLAFYLDMVINYKNMTA